jgi:hypothetical protein
MAFKKGSKEAKAHMAKVRASKISGVKKKVVKKAVAKKKVVKKAVAKKKIAPRKKTVAKKKVNISYDNSWGKYLDSQRPALPPGRRIAKTTGIPYTENRANHSDKRQTKKRGQMLGINDIRLTRINNDTNGNPRYVVHFLEFLNDEENEFLDFSKKYDYALKKAKKIGGRKFHNKQYGGGVVFQSYNTDKLKNDIMQIQNSHVK